MKVYTFLAVLIAASGKVFMLATFMVAILLVSWVLTHGFMLVNPVGDIL